MAVSTYFVQFIETTETIVYWNRLENNQCNS